jgi:3-phosphoshikimate 1-carboxyvinyltransferase
MALPELIEIVPLSAPVTAAVTVPGSKSITNRALILAALADGKKILKGALWSEDTQVMTECLRRLGFVLELFSEPAEPSNRTITIEGRGGLIPKAGEPGEPLELFVGNAGTAARFLAALVCLGHGVYRLTGVPRMHERPQAALFDALRQLGYRVDSANNKLPAIIYGAGPRKHSCTVSIEQSSQFASALMLAATKGEWEIEVIGENADESPYVAMTGDLLDAFAESGPEFKIEPDASSASYFWGANWLLNRAAPTKPSLVKAAHWMKNSLQIDAQFPLKIGDFPPVLSRQTDLGDSIMTAITLAPFADSPKKFTDLARLRVQECERVAALRTELGKCGVHVEERGETLTIWPGPVQPATIETYNDHRMAMCFGTLGLKASGIRIHNPACVRKTFPDFFQKLAQPAPEGLGATILDPRSGLAIERANLVPE